MLLIAVLLLLAGLAWAHPHMWFSSAADFVWKGTRLSGVYLTWTFDDYFSADIIRGYDTNGDGKFDADEISAIYNNAFINLKNYYYFTFIRQEDVRTNPDSVEEFSASQKNGVLSYYFFVDLSHTTSGPIALAVYDYTFFCDISLDPNDIKLTYDPALIHPVFKITENKDYPVYYNPVGAIDDTTIYYKWKKGLQTYYPHEIRITYEDVTNQ